MRSHWPASRLLLYAPAWVLVLVAFVPQSALAQPPAGENQLLNRLLQRGVDLTDEVTVKLPVPAFADGLDKDQQREAVTRIAGRYGWPAFVRQSSVAPFVLQQTYVKDKQGQRVGHAVDLWFIAYGRLADFQDQELAKDLFGADAAEEDKSSAASLRELSDEELSRGLSAAVDKKTERFVLAEFPLLNRVQVRGIGHGQQSRAEQSLLVAWELDARFAQDEQLANRWFPIETTELGDRRLGTARPYQGYGGYLKITTLHEPAGALLFEAHTVFHEPEEWFAGSNQLRAKTPLMVEESIGKLRRKLARTKR